MKDANRKTISRRHLLQTGAMLASGGFITSAPWVALAQAQQPVPADGTVQRFTIANEWVERTISFSAGYGVRTERLAGKAIGAEFIQPVLDSRTFASRWIRYEFSFHCNGKAYQGADPELIFSGAENGVFDGGKSLSITLRQPSLSVEITLTYRVYDGHPAVRKFLALRNTGKATLRISHLIVESQDFSLGPENEITLDALYGSSPRELLYTGRSEDAALLLTNSRTSVGMAIISEVPGYMKRTEIAGWDEADRVKVAAMYDTDLMPFERTIAPGETFATAAVSLVPYRLGDGLHDSRWVLPSYTANVLMRRVNRQGPPWIYNTWEPFQRGVNHDLVMELIEAASAMGLEIFTIDDGWQKEYGENTVDPTAFPGGLSGIQQALESKGMRLGLWVPLAAIGRGTAAYQQHPEWAARDLEGLEKTTGTAAGEKVVMCLASSFRDAAAERVNAVIQKFNLAYVKLDITTIFNAYGEAPGCWAKGHNHGSWSESLNRIYEGMAYVTRKIYEQHPDVLLDLTFELWGQKHLIDAGLLAAGDLDWLSNVDDTQPHSAGPIQARQLLYQRSAAMPVESMLIGNIHAELPSKEESFATAIGSAPLLLGDLRKLSVSDRAWYKEKTRWYRQLRRARSISDSFFPLGSWTQTAASRWDGYARMARSGHGIVALFRNQSGTPSALVQVSVMPPGKYKLRSVFTGAEIGSFSESDWAKGISIAFPGSASVELIEVTPG